MEASACLSACAGTCLHACTGRSSLNGPPASAHSSRPLAAATCCHGRRSGRTSTPPSATARWHAFTQRSMRPLTGRVLTPTRWSTGAPQCHAHVPCSCGHVHMRVLMSAYVLHLCAGAPRLCQRRSTPVPPPSMATNGTVLSQRSSPSACPSHRLSSTPPSLAMPPASLAASMESLNSPHGSRRPFASS